MAVPKKRQSRSRRNKRRANFKLAMPAITPCPSCGAAKLSHRVCLSCGTYKGVAVFEVKKDK
ncbi:MAG: 50S ribosomal protein L32 [Eubacteriaceae bacterium]|nr:50S ribosomal protein L32 [Eubacteriaceae bacterium]